MKLERRLRTSESLRKPLRGRAVDAADGMLHIEGADDGVTLCGEPVESYPLHWDTKTVIACGVCLMEAGVPLHTTTHQGAAIRPDGEGEPPEANRGLGEEAGRTDGEGRVEA